MSELVEEELPDFASIDPPEESRTYIFPTGQVTIRNVCALLVRPSGTHRIDTSDGLKYIIPTGWLAIKFKAEKWSF